MKYRFDRLIIFIHLNGDFHCKYLKKMKKLFNFGKYLYFMFFFLFFKKSEITINLLMFQYLRADLSH
jgi:hypothetical protein